MSENNHPNRFLVNLDHSRSPRAFKGQQNLWQADIGRLYDLLERHVDGLPEPELSSSRGDSKKQDHPHLSIAIFGPSGSGKSSLLRTVTADVGRHDTLLPDALRRRVKALRVMDPTTWGESDQFLYAFLAAALEEERVYQKEKQHGYPQGLSPVQLAFQEVNEYLRVVDEPERHEEHDPLGLSLQKLERHTSGLRLRNALSDLINALANELSADIVLLPVDDLDMAPKHLMKSIQTYQSFLTHPRLVPIFTFTDRMPEELLEATYREMLKEKKGEERHRKHVTQLSVSEQLAVQFLARSFPVRNRIRLGPAPARVQRAMFEVQATVQKDGKKKISKKQAEVRELLTIASFLLFGHSDRDDSHQVRAALRPSTLRRQFQVVDAMMDCRLKTLSSPHLEVLAGIRDPEPETREQNRPRGSNNGQSVLEDPDFSVKEAPKPPWCHKDLVEVKKGKPLAEYSKVTEKLIELEIDATWASIFNGACWSLLNVHRDTLRELGLYLEDLYSWSPKELRSVVLDNILLQDRATRRTVVDRWFNRTDYRRSQVLSILAANVFRPWMIGEEPYGDEEIPLRKQLAFETEEAEVLKGAARSRRPILDVEQYGSMDAKTKGCQVKQRLSFSVTDGCLWFLNVTLGFYMPQIMARNWSEAHPESEVRERMGGNGWDLQNAPINAARMADAKQEIFSFGMVILDNRGYRLALGIKPIKEQYSDFVVDTEKISNDLDNGNNQQLIDEFNRDASLFAGASAVAEDTQRKSTEIALLRIWSCFGYSYGRYWSIFSLWRGLGFIGQVLELGWRKLGNSCESKSFPSVSEDTLKHELEQLIRGHCLKGMVQGPLFSQTPEEKKLLQGFPAWDPELEPLKEQIKTLAEELAEWLKDIQEHRIFPLPAGGNRVGWRNCFVRRVHGEYILGALWPRLNATILEKQDGLGRFVAQWRAGRIPGHDEKPQEVWSEENEGFRWNAAIAASAWSDILLEYWRGCPGMLYLLLSCPSFYKNRLRFRKIQEALDSGVFNVRWSKANSQALINNYIRKDVWLERLFRGDRGGGDEQRKFWSLLLKNWNQKGAIPGLVGTELFIERTKAGEFGYQLPQAKG